MIVKKLVLKNFLNHREEAVEFPEQGIILLSGESGAGKSGFLEAIGFALYGYHATRAKTLEELRHHDADEGDTMSVTLTLSAENDKDYEVYRGLEAGKTVVRVRDADGTVYEGPRNVNSALLEILGGLDAKTFYTSFFAQQNELSTLTGMQGAERRQFIHRVLGIDVLDAATKNASKKLRNKKTEIEILLKLQPQARLSEKEAELKQQQDEFYVHLATLLQAQELLRAAEKDSQRVRDEIKENEAAAAAIESLTHREQVISEGKAPNLRRSLAELQELLPRIQEQQAALAAAPNVDELPELEERLKLSQQFLVAERKSTECEAALVAVRAQADELPAEATRENVAAWEAQKAAAATDAKKLRTNLKLLEHEQKCVTCLRPLDAEGAKQVFDDLDTAAAAAEATAASLGEKIEVARPQSKRREVVERKLASLEDKSAELRRQLDGIVVDGEVTEETIAVLAQAVEDLSAQAATVQQARAFVDAHGGGAVEEKIADSTTELEGYEAELETIAEERVGVVFDADDYARAKESLAEATNKERALEQDAVAQTHDLRSNTESAARLRKEIGLLGEQLAQLKGDEKQSQHFSELEQLLKEFKQRLSLQIRPQIEEITSEILNALSSGKFASVQVDEDYEIKVEHHGRAVPIRMISGGEEERANLCLRLAITRLVSARTGVPLRFIVLDEIFGAQDEQHRQLIIDSLDELRNYYPQIFLVSHVGDLPDSEFINAIISFDNSKQSKRAEVIART